MMEAVVIVAGACQLASWLFAVVDAIEAPPKKGKPFPVSLAARRGRTCKNQPEGGR